MELNLECYFRSKDKFNNLFVSVDTANMNKLLNIQKTLWPELKEIKEQYDFSSPIGERTVKIKCDHWEAMPKATYEYNEKMTLRLKVQRFAFGAGLQKKVGWKMKVVFY
jgi:hypothetical protein